MTEFISAAATAITLIGGFVVWFLKFHKSFTDFMDDWRGEPERPGVPGRPGVMARLSTIEDRVAQLDKNGGSTVRDAVERTESKVDALRSDFDDYLSTRS